MNANSTTKPAPALAKWLSAFGWLPNYDRSWLRGDIVAGITLAARLGRVDRFTSLADAVDLFQKTNFGLKASMKYFTTKEPKHEN